MTKKKHEPMAKRAWRMRKKRLERLYPFDEQTTLSSFLTKHHRNRIATFLEAVRPWLLEEPGPPLAVTRIMIDWCRVPRGEYWRVYEPLARLTHLSNGDLTTEDELIYLCRYLCHPSHGNFKLHETALKAAINRWVRHGN